MPSTSENFTLPKRHDSDDKMVDFNQNFSSPGVSDPIRLRESDQGIAVQVSGNATSFSGMVERSTRDPIREVPNWSPAEDEGWSGDLTLGVSPRVYDEPSRGWWRFNLTEITGGTLQLNITGERA